MRKLLCVKAPDEPADIKVVGLSGTTALLTWLPPNFPNGIITKYTLYWKTEDSKQTKEKVVAHRPTYGEDEFTQKLRGLDESGRYSFWVTAHTNAGIGKPSRTVSMKMSSILWTQCAKAFRFQHSCEP